MKNIWLLLRGDLKRLTRNVVTVIIVLGLVFLPSLFSWYNLIACWNVFDNTGNLKVAVANADEGYVSDLVPIEINVGEKVISELRANDQLEWVFTTEEDAIDGARSGRYYAAVVIPPSFSRDMMTFFSDGADHARIVYYSNEKKNAIAPKVTDQGADKVSAEVNKVFAKTLSEAALGLSSAMFQYADATDASGRIAALSGHIAQMGEQMGKAADLLGSYAGLLSSSQAILSDSARLIGQVKGSAEEVMASVDSATGASEDIAGALGQAASSLSTALSQSAASFGGVPAAVDEAFASTGTLAADSAAQMRTTAAAVDSQIASYRDLVGVLEAILPALPAQDQSTAQALVDSLKASIALQEQLRDSLNGAAGAVESGNADAQAKHAEIKQLAEDAQTSLEGVKSNYDESVKPGLDELSGTVASASSSLRETTSLLGSVGSGLSGAADSLNALLAGAQSQLLKASEGLRETSGELIELSGRIDAALASGDSGALREIVGSDPMALASALSAPVELDRHEIYPVDNFGSAMSPLYTTLALWIGALLIMVTLKPAPSQRTLRELDNPTAPQMFIGRFGIVALLSFLQSTVMCLGNLFFLRVQASEPWLYLLCFWVSGLVFSFIIYTLVVSFANLGKAISVFLLIIQVSGGGGSYPLSLLPDFVQNASPYLPITHAVNAMRSAMFGVYQGDFWIQLGELLLFVLPFALLGLVLRNPLIKIVSKFVERVESTKLM